MGDDVALYVVVWYDVTFCYGVSNKGEPGNHNAKYYLYSSTHIIGFISIISHSDHKSLVTTGIHHHMNGDNINDLHIICGIVYFVLFSYCGLWTSIKTYEIYTKYESRRSWRTKLRETIQKSVCGNKET